MEIEFRSPAYKLKSNNCRSLHYIAGVFGENRPTCVGIDPGVNFGLTFIHNQFAHIYYGTLKQEQEPGLYAARAWMLFDELDIPETNINCVIEGAAYHKQFGQVGLAEVRIGFYLYAFLNNRYSNVKIVPPATIRKAVTGDGRKQAMDEYPQINHNAADSIYCALYGSRLCGDSELTPNT